MLAKIINEIQKLLPVERVNYKKMFSNISIESSGKYRGLEYFDPIFRSCRLIYVFVAGKQQK